MAVPRTPARAWINSDELALQNVFVAGLSSRSKAAQRQGEETLSESLGVEFSLGSATTLAYPVVIPAVVAGNVNKNVPWSYGQADMAVNTGTSFVYPLAPTNNGVRKAKPLFVYQVSFDAEFREVEMIMSGGNAEWKARVWVNEMPSPYEVTTSGKKWLKIKFPSRSARARVMIEVDFNVAFEGIVREKSDSIQLPSSNCPLKIAGVGDSFMLGAGINPGGASGPSSQAYWYTLCRLLGFNRTRMYGMPGTGLLTEASIGTYRERINDILSYAPDIAFIQGSTNDGEGHSQAEYENEVAAYASALKKGLPETSRIIACSVMPLTTASAAEHRNNAIGCKIAWERAQIPYIDGYGEEWFQGTGKVGAVTNEGNSDFYESSVVASHPSLAGHSYMAQRLAGQIAQILGVGL